MNPEESGLGLNCLQYIGYLSIISEGMADQEFS